MRLSPAKIELCFNIALLTVFPLVIAVAAWFLLHAQFAADRPHIGFNYETLNLVPMVYVGACSTLATIVVLLGVRGLFLRITEVVIGGTLLFLLAVLIITGIERFTIYTWTGEYVLAALFYTVVFAVLWICLRCRQRFGFAETHTTDSDQDTEA